MILANCQRSKDLKINKYTTIINNQLKIYNTETRAVKAAWPHGMELVDLIGQRIEMLLIVCQLSRDVIAVKAAKRNWCV